LQNKYLKSTMSIAPVAFEDISHQLEAGLPEDGNKSSAKADFAVAPLKGGKSRFITFSTVFAAAVGVGLILGLSLGLSGGDESNSQSAAVEQPAVSNSNPESSFNGSTSTPVKNYLCAFAGQIPADGTIILGQSIMPTSSDRTLEDVPACFDGADTDGAWNSAWYKVRACKDGEMTATFSDLYTPTLNTETSALDTRVSAYQGSCGEQLQCIGTQYQDMENSRLGSSTWTAVKGEMYKLRVQHMPGASFGLTVTYKTVTYNTGTSTQSSLLLNNMCANADPIPVDGTVVIGNAGIALPEDLPVCVEGRRHADGGWYTVQAEKTGRMVANFVAFYEHDDIDDFVSVYEGECGDVVTCVDGSYAFDGNDGYYAWDAVEGVDYKIVVHSTGPFSLDVQ
jgi:hypothetical protein